MQVEMKNVSLESWVRCIEQVKKNRTKVWCQSSVINLRKESDDSEISSE